MLAWWLDWIFRIPVHVVIACHGIPGAIEFFHDASKLAHLVQPLLAPVESVDQITHRHYQIRIQQIGIADGLLQHADSFGRTTRSIADNHKLECVFFFFGQRKDT